VAEQRSIDFFVGENTNAINLAIGVMAVIYIIPE
jgi:hypothetical protein